jgi:hypothetical protein
VTRTAVIRAVALSLLGALLFGVVGYVRSLETFPTYQATLQMRIEPDPVVGAEATRSEVDPATFLASELVVLNGPELRASLEELLPTEVNVLVRTEQVGSTAVVVVSATGPTEADARAGADAVAARYAGRRKQDLLRRIASVRAEVDRQLRVTSERVEELAELSGVTSEVQRSALTAEYSRLIEVQNNLQLAADASARLVTVVKPTDVGGVNQIVEPRRDAAVWSVFGAIAGLALALGITRWRRRVSGLDELLEMSPELALPTLPALRGRALDVQAGVAAASYVSALTPPGGAFARPALVVVAPRVGAGATTVAVGLAVASARRGPTVLLAAGDALDGAAARLLGVDQAAVDAAVPGTELATRHDDLFYVVPVEGRGPKALAALEQRLTRGLLSSLTDPARAVVVDAPALSRSSVGLDLAREAGQALLVGGVEHTRATELEAAATSLRRVGGTLIGIVLSSPPSGLLRRRARAR